MDEGLTMRIGLIGKKLGHSFSKLIHEKLIDQPYELIELNEQELVEFMTSKEFKAINVTIPYKETVMEYCDEIDEQALAIHAVNAIVNRKGRLIATNTDFAGLKLMLEHHNIEIKDKVCCVLGTGGTSKTARAVLKAMGAKEILIAGRNKPAPIISYEELKQHKEIQVFINATSVGMYPNNDEQIIDLSSFDKLEAVADVIYNPLTTRLCQQAEDLKLKHVNGLEMLVAQAKVACEFFHDIKIEDDKINQITAEIYRDMANIVIIGMPSSGKTTISKELAKISDKQFIDIDEEIVHREQRTIREIFDTEGEAAFRQIETEVCKDIAKHTKQIISCGGGIIKNEENMRSLAQNGIIFHIRRSLDVLLVDDSRPLSSSKERLKEMEIERMPLYQKYSHFEIDNNTTIEAALKQIKERFDEVTCN